jgi:hypothetical protein
MDETSQQKQEETQAVKAAKWDRIAAAWETYCTDGAGAFDWDYDSRDLMRELGTSG